MEGTKAYITKNCHEKKFHPSKIQKGDKILQLDYLYDMMDKFSLGLKIPFNIFGDLGTIKAYHITSLEGEPLKHSMNFPHLNIFSYDVH